MTSNSTARAVLSVPEAARLLGVSRNHAYEVIAQTDELAGIPAIRCGKRIVIPRRPFEAKLGITTPDATGTTASDDEQHRVS